MLFPEAAKAAISKTFYDKEVSILAKTETIDSEGGVVKAGETVKSTFKGNVRFVLLEEVQSELGLTEEIDIAITCDTYTDVKVDDFLSYKGVKYVALGVLPRDSHIMIAGKKWRG